MDFASIGENVKGVLFNKKFIMILIVVVIFLGIAFYVYNTYISPRMNPDFVTNREFTDEGEGYADIHLFHVDWCPYSKKTLPIWNKLKKKYDGNKINNSVIKFVEINGEKNSKELENFEDKYLNGKKIDGYPSIYLVKNDQVIEFEAKPSKETLTEFINSVL